MPHLSLFTSHLSPRPSALPYNSELSLWLSVDPLSDKYPSVSPYVYCADNPVGLVDVDGREPIPIPWPSKGVWTFSTKAKVGAGINYGGAASIMGGISLDRHGMTHWTAASLKYLTNQNLQEGSSNPAIELGFDLSISAGFERNMGADNFIEAVNSTSYSLSVNGKCIVGGSVNLGDDVYGASVGIGLSVGASSDQYQIIESISLSKNEANEIGYSASWNIVEQKYSEKNNAYFGYVEANGKRTNILVYCSSVNQDGKIKPNGIWTSKNYLNE